MKTKNRRADAKALRNDRSRRCRGVLGSMIGLCLGLIASSAHAELTFEVQIDSSVLLHNDADATITIEGVSNGVPFLTVNPSPAPAPTWAVSLPGDFVTFRATGSARSGPTGMIADAGDSAVSATMNMTALGDGQPIGGSGVAAGFAIAYLISASGDDAFATVNGDLRGTSPYDPDAAPTYLLTAQAQADTVYGDSEDFLDVGTFGGPLVKDKLWIWPGFGSQRPLAPGGEGFASGTLSGHGAAISSTANYEASMTFSLSAVPEPAAAWLLGSALAVLGWMRRNDAERKRR